MKDHAQRRLSASTVTAPVRWKQIASATDSSDVLVPHNPVIPESKETPAAFLPQLLTPNP